MGIMKLGGLRVQRAGSSDSPCSHPTSQVLLTQKMKVVQSANSSLNSAATQEKPPLLMLRAMPSMILVSRMAEVLHGFHLMPFVSVKTPEASPVLRQNFKQGIPLTQTYLLAKPIPKHSGEGHWQSGRHNPSLWQCSRSRARQEGTGV